MVKYKIFLIKRNFSMKQPRFLIRLLCAALAVLLLAGCGKPAASEEAPETTAATEPTPTTPPNGNPNDATCLGSYTASTADVKNAASTVVATAGGAELTLGQLQLYYWLEVAEYRLSDAENQPDYGLGLEFQSCPIDNTVASWQQYFLKAALNTWHMQQALVLTGQEEGFPKQDEYSPDLEKHAEYMTDKPAYQFHTAHFESYQPNTMHQAYLDAIPDTLNTLATDMGFADTAALAEAISGTATGADLEAVTELVNRAYMYFTEVSYHFEPTDEDVETWYSANQSSISAEDGCTVDFRHILLIPDDAEIAADGTVTCSEESWDATAKKAQSLVDKWLTAVKKTKYANQVPVPPAESRFSEFAKDHSADEGSRANGGLYVNIRKGQLPEELDAWCFDPARQFGDYEILRSDCGCHIVFFSKATENRFAAAKAGLILEMSRDLVKTAMDKHPADIRYSDIKLAQAPDNGSFVTAGDLLYPDVAHERFPEVPLYMQQDYPEAPFGAYKVSSHGCGITTLAMVASYMADDELTPAELAARYGYYCGVRGSEISLFDYTPAEMGFHLDTRSFSWNEIHNAVENGQIVVSLQWAGYWTSGGHYIAITEIAEDEKYVVRDSNLLNYKRIKAHVEDAHTRGSITPAAQFFWIYEPKVVRIPACVRCSEDLTAGAPGTFFQEDYHCSKCLTAMSRRDTYLSKLN